MKNTKRIFAIVFALLMTLALCCAAFAEEAPASTEAAGSADDTTTVGAIETEKAESASYQLGYEVLDGEGNPVRSTGLLSCVGAVPLYIKHDYTIVTHYYDPSTRQRVETAEPAVARIENDNGNVTFEGNKIIIKAADTPCVFNVKFADDQESYSISINRYNLSLVDIIIALLGVYVVINALRGRGGLFSDEFIKEEKKEDFKRIMKLLAVVAGIALVASAVLTIFFSYIDATRTIKLVLIGIAILCLLGMSIINNKFTDKEKREKARATALTGGHTSSAAAFEFDENEPTLDDVLADIENNKDSDTENK